MGKMFINECYISKTGDDFGVDFAGLCSVILQSNSHPIRTSSQSGHGQQSMCSGIPTSEEGIVFQRCSKYDVLDDSSSR